MRGRKPKLDGKMSKYMQKKLEAQKNEQNLFNELTNNEQVSQTDVKIEDFKPEEEDILMDEQTENTNNFDEFDETIDENNNNYDEQNEQQQAPPQIDTSVPHTYLLVLQTSNMLLSKMFKRDLTFTEAEMQSLNPLFWQAYPQVIEMNPKTVLFMNLGALYVQKLGIIKF